MNRNALQFDIGCNQLLTAPIQFGLISMNYDNSLTDNGFFIEYLHLWMR